MKISQKAPIPLDYIPSKEYYDEYLKETKGEKR
jgi:hypothetical protein